VVRGSPSSNLGRYISPLNINQLTAEEIAKIPGLNKELRKELFRIGRIRGLFAISQGLPLSQVSRKR
jgi:hypothetical protein